jgi:hypothetical protein
VKFLSHPRVETRISHTAKNRNCAVSLVRNIIVPQIIKEEVLITVGCPIFPSILIAKYLFTGSLKNKSIDNLETQKKYISMKNSQFFN